jgi:hypothetical protein
MSNPRRPLFESSIAALDLVNSRRAAWRTPTAWTLGPAGRLSGRGAAGMSIQFAPEPDPTCNAVDLGQDQTTGPLPLGFEFEFFGVRYTWFDLSSDGFITFGTDSCPGCSDAGPRRRFIPLSADLNKFIALGWANGRPFGRSKVFYEVRGVPERRRLVLSFAGIPPSREGAMGPMIAQLVLHERTGLVDVHITRRDPVSYRVNQEAVRFTTAPW